jgi:hypothetical protein
VDIKKVNDHLATVIKSKPGAVTTKYDKQGRYHAIVVEKPASGGNPGISQKILIDDTWAEIMPDGSKVLHEHTDKQILDILARDIHPDLKGG